MKATVIHLSANRLNQQEKRSGYTYPGKIVAAAEWREKGTKKESMERPKTMDSLNEKGERNYEK